MLSTCRSVNAGVEAATLQALDSAVFERIIKGEELQPGFRHSNTERPDAFDRVEAVLANVTNQFGAFGKGNGTKRKCEVWEFSSSPNEPKVTITNPHWTPDDENNPTSVTAMEGSNYYSVPLNAEVLTFTGTGSIRTVCNLLVAHLETMPRINMLKERIEECSRNDWAKSKAARRAYRLAGAPPAA